MRKPDTIEHLYLDFDGFFASVEQLRDPSLRGRPVGIDEALSARDRATLEDLLVRVETEPNLANALLGDGFQCWFCGLGIDRADGPALSIGLWELWNGGAGDEPTQTIYAHFHCAEIRMKGASMSLERDTFLSDEEES